MSSTRKPVSPMVPRFCTCIFVPPPSNEKKQAAPPATPSQPWNIHALPAPGLANNVLIASAVANAAAPSRSSEPQRSTSPRAASSAVAGAAVGGAAVVDGTVDAVVGASGGD